MGEGAEIKLNLVNRTEVRPAAGVVVFIHGLGGDAYSTWQYGKSKDSFWPQWIADDLNQIDVYSLGYDAAPSKWLGGSLPLFDRAKQALTELEDLADQPILFICHSMGGLLLKEMLQQGQSGGVDEWKPVAQQTRGVVFLATPHVGADLADVFTKLGGLLSATVSVKELEKNHSQLRRLNEWYQNNAPRLGIKTISFYETKPVAGFLVVDQSSANPGIGGAATIPLDTDHFGVCKPPSREGLPHSKVTRFIRRCFQISGQTTAEQDSADFLADQDRSANGEARSSSEPIKIFISYKRSASDDEQLADSIRRKCEAMGHEVFIDVGMQVGTDWVGEISKRIEWCDYLVVLLSERAAGSEMVQAEVRLAHRHYQESGKPGILPVRMNFEGPLDYELDAYLSRIQYVRWQGNFDDERVMAELLEAISVETPTALREDGSVSIEQLDPIYPDKASSDLQRPLVSQDPRVLVPPGGTIRLDDSFYIHRRCDSQLQNPAVLRGQTVVLKGARQMGKSSALIRYLAACKKEGKQFIFIDFQSFSQSTIEDYPRLLRACARIVLRQLKLETDHSLEFESQQHFTEFVEDVVLSQIAEPITFAMDEVDRVFGQPYQADFFSMLRHWHNSRANPSSLWEDFDIALVISTEPYLLIDTDDRSPFNVTPPIEVEPFSLAEVGEMNTAYGGVLENRELDELFELLGGHPFLTRLVFYRLSTDPDSDFNSLVEDASSNDGPFGDHLRSKLFHLQRDAILLKAMRQVIANRTVSNRDEFYRLRGAGLVAEIDGRTVPANMLYARFFKTFE